MAYKTVDVEIDLDDFDDNELINELELRKCCVPISIVEIVHSLHEHRRTGQDYQHLLDKLIYETIGKLV